MSETHPAAGRVYQKLGSQLSAFDLSSTLDGKLDHLLALLYVISADGAEVFIHLPESIQTSYLVACCELAQDCVDINHMFAGELAV